MYMIRCLLSNQLEAIEPCPHCDNKNLNIVQEIPKVQQIHCMDCNMRGPEARTRMAAIELWNNLYY